MKKAPFALLLLVAAAGAVAAPVPDGPGPWVVRAFFTDPAMVAAFAARHEPWEVRRDNGYLVVDVDRAEWQRLLALGFEVEIDARLTAALLKPSPAHPWQVNGIPGYPCYRTVEETFAAAASLAVARPDLATWIDAGDSWEKTQSSSAGYDLGVLRLTNAAVPGPKPALFVMAAIHAREYTTAELVTRFAEKLVGDYDVDPDVTWLLDHHVIHLLLQSNPDGRKRAETGLYWRKNTDNQFCAGSDYRGVDLNRNFDFKWGCCGGSSGQQCDETYRGPSAGSEPETQAVQAYVRSAFPDQWNYPVEPSAPVDATGVFLDIHSSGELVLWPWGWTYTVAPNGNALRTLGRRFAYLNGHYPEQSVGLYPTDGTTDDFSYGDLGVAAYTFELGSSFFQDCATFTSNILPGNLDALLYAARVARAPYLMPSGPDARTGAVTPTLVTRGDPVVLTSTVDDTRFSNQNGTEPTQNIAAAEYFVDDPPWVNPGGASPMAAVDGTFDQKTEAVTATIDSSGMTAGRHIIFVRGRDAQGSVGPVGAVFLWVQDPGGTATIAGFVREAGTLLPLQATVASSAFQTTSDPGTGAYSLDVPAGVYDVTASAPAHGPVTVPGVAAVTGQTTQLDFALYPLCTVLADDVESGAGGFVADAPWAITTESSSSPTHSFTDSPGGPYADGVDVSLTSAPLDLSGYSGLTLSFLHTYDLEDGYDYAFVETSTDDGATWATATSYNGYGHTTWSPEAVDLAALDGVATARFRFRLVTDQGVTADGWHVDDIVLEGAGPVCGGGSTPAVDIVAGQGKGQPNPNRVRVFRDGGSATATDFFAYASGAWGVGIAAGDLDGPPHDEILTGPGPGPIFGPHVRAFRRSGVALPNVSFYAYGTLRFGVNPGAGLLDGDAFDEILTGAGPGAVFGPHVRAFDVDGGSARPIARVSFYAYGTLRYGVNVSATKLDADGHDELLTGAGPGAVFAPTVRGFDYDGLSVAAIAKVRFDAFAALRYGASVAGGDVDGDGYGEIAVAPGPGPTYAARFTGYDYDGNVVVPLPGFDVTPGSFTTGYGGRLAVGDLDLDGRVELLAGAGPDPAAASDVLSYDYDGSTLDQRSGAFAPFPAGYGVEVAAATLDL